ncbi:hypothetical protein JKP88DRAFT_226261, partial [Tribonema minus]
MTPGISRMPLQRTLAGSWAAFWCLLSFLTSLMFPFPWLTSSLCQNSTMIATIASLSLSVLVCRCKK